MKKTSFSQGSKIILNLPCSITFIKDQRYIFVLLREMRPSIEVSFVERLRGGLLQKVVQRKEKGGTSHKTSKAMFDYGGLLIEET